MTVYKREGSTPQDAWNAMIRAVNDLSQNPDPGCEALSPLPEVQPDHKWSKTDIQEVQNRLVEICSDNEFSDPPELWKQSIIDELQAAVDNGWCNCESILEISACPKTFFQFAEPDGVPSTTVPPINAYLALITQAQANNVTQRNAAFATYQKRQQLVALIAGGGTPAQIAALEAEIAALEQTENNLLDALDALLDTIYAQASTLVASGPVASKYVNCAAFLNAVRVPIGDQDSFFVRERWALEAFDAVNVPGGWGFLFGQTTATRQNVIRSGRLIPPNKTFEFANELILQGYPIIEKPSASCNTFGSPDVQFWCGSAFSFFAILPECQDYRVVRYDKNGVRLDFN